MSSKVWQGLDSDKVCMKFLSISLPNCDWAIRREASHSGHSISAPHYTDGVLAKEKRLLSKEIGGKIDRVSRQKMATKAQLLTRYDTVEAG